MPLYTIETQTMDQLLSDFQTWEVRKKKVILEQYIDGIPIAPPQYMVKFVYCKPKTRWNPETQREDIEGYQLLFYCNE